MDQASHPISSRLFERDGYTVVRGMLSPAEVTALRGDISEALQPLLGPAEFESDVGYPGAPGHRDAPGGDTPRRLLAAAARFPRLRAWALSNSLRQHLRALTGQPDMRASQCHHNCVMTKHPGYSSATLWHQDIRYWSFDRPELISVWLALGEEDGTNGALKVIPGSHNLDIDRGRFDAELFLRPDLAENKPLIRAAVDVELAPGDVLFFHCRLFHAAGTNRTSDVKLSAVFTYHGPDNHPIPETRSAQYPSLAMAHHDG